MAPQPRTRTIPCDKCREKHLKCDGEIPCANCKKGSASCIRASKKFRVKRLITSQNNLTFDPDQTWIQTSATKHEPLAIINESDGSTKHSATESSCHDDPMQGNLNFAASVLQTISRDGRQDEESTRQRLPSVQEQQNVVFDNADIISNDTGINDLTSASPSSSLSVSAHSKTSVPEYHETNPNAHFMFHTQWQHSSPGVASTTTQRRPRPVAQSTQSPYNTDEFRYSLPPLSAMASHDSPGIVRSARVGQVLNLDIQESCLVKCFVENLARAFDTSDRDHHYVSVLPLRAMHSPLLLNAICTASARFLTQVWSLRDPSDMIQYDGIPLPNLTMESAIHYHNKCISHLMDASTDLENSCSDDALTAITILRYHEQVDTHFTGMDNETFTIAVQAVFEASQDNEHGLLSIILQPPRGSNIYASSLSSLRYSACLIALRQEIWSVLIHGRSFRLPLLPVYDYGSLDDTISADDYDWTNRIIVWCAHALKFCFRNDEDTYSGRDRRSRTEQWEALKKFQNEWDEQPPPHFIPLFHEEPDPTQGRHFPMIWLNNRCQIMGLQHVELARIVLAVHDSKLQRIGIGANAAHQALEELLRNSTRRICGLAMSNQNCQEAMVTAAVGVSLCGEYFRDAGEQAAVVELMSTLEEKHAWPTSRVIGALREAWSCYEK